MLPEEESANAELRPEDEAVETMEVQQQQQVEEVEVLEVKQDVSVLVMMPDSSQQLITLEMPALSGSDEQHYIVQAVQSYLREICAGNQFDIWKVTHSNAWFDYFIETFPNIDISNDEKIIEERRENFGPNMEFLQDYLQCSNNDNYDSPGVYYNQTIYERNEDNDFEIDVGNEVEIGVETDNCFEVEVLTDEVTNNNVEEEEVEVDVEGTEDLETLRQFEPKSTDCIDVSETESKSPKQNEYAEHSLFETSNSDCEDAFESRSQPEDKHIMYSTIELSDSPVIGRARRKSASIAAMNVLTIYPAPPEKGGISINSEDYKCLGQSKLLNDVIIDFYLKYLANELLSQADQQRTHIFSSHFYSRLAKPYEIDDSENTTIAQKRHSGVERWTKNVNVFEKDFVIVPVNEDAHWYLAIICFPHLVGNVGGGQHNCFLNGDELQMPCILIFDSLSTTGKSEVAEILRQYLHYEYMTKMREEKIFNKNTLKSVYPSVPEQSNGTDCGLYVLQFVESFFMNPIKDFTLPFKDLSNWFKRNVVVCKRQEIASLISKLASVFHKGKKVTLPSIKFPSPDRALSNNDEITSFPISKGRRGKIDLTKTAQPFHSEIEKSEHDNNNIEEWPVGELLFDDEVEQPIPLRRGKGLNDREITSFLMKNQSNTGSGNLIPEPKKTTTSQSRSNRSRLIELTRTIAAKKEKKATQRTQRVCNRSSKPNNTSVSSSTKESLFFASKPTDKFYALSFDALKNDSSISPSISFAKFKKMKQ